MKAAEPAPAPESDLEIEVDDPSKPVSGDESGDAWKVVSSQRPLGPREGDVLAGRYRLISRLGEGGMGSVWRARSLVLEVDVAVKVVKHGASSSKACDRLLREARAAAAVAHPSIVRVFDFGTTDDGQPFLVMQLLKGKTLRTWLHERGRIPATLAVQIVLPLAAALAEVHGLGIMHRDIKPENILVEEGSCGQLVPKLVDFGIAKQSGEAQDNFTQSGVLMGSPAYMAPEQARGKPDPQSDIWSLCVVLYEMITGRRPFEGPNHGAVLFAVFGDEPEPTHAQGAGDEELWRILKRGLEKKQEARFRSMKQLGRALAGWAAPRGITEDAAGVSLAHEWFGKRFGRVVTEQPTTPVARRARHGEPTGATHPTGAPGHTSEAHHTSSVHHVHMISSRPPAEPGGGDAPLGIRMPVLGLGGAIVVVVGILTFLALSSPATPPAEAADRAEASVVAASLAIAPEPAAAEPPSAVPAVTPAPSVAASIVAATVSAPASIAAATVSAPAAASAKRTAVPPAAIVTKAPAARATAKPAAKGPPAAAQRRPVPVRAPMPLPSGPDF